MRAYDNQDPGEEVDREATGEYSDWAAEADDRAEQRADAQRFERRYN